MSQPAKARICAGCWLLALNAAGAIAADWVAVDASDANQHYYDRSKVVAEADSVTYWRRVVFYSPQSTKSGSARSAMYRERIDCRMHTYRTLGYLVFSIDGAIIDNVYTPDAAAEPVVPETIGDYFEKLMCTLTAASRSPAPTLATEASSAAKAEPSLTAQEAMRAEIGRLEARLRELKAQLPPADDISSAANSSIRATRP